MEDPAEQPQEEPEWLKHLEEQREKRRQGKLGHEAGAGSPCLSCNECPGLDLHFWRKICKTCKCKKDAHDVVEDDLVGCAQFQLLGGKSKLQGKDGQGQNEWLEQYLSNLPPEVRPTRGSAAAQEYKKLFQMQVPLTDIGPEWSDRNFKEEEYNKLNDYIKELKLKSVGLGQPMKLRELLKKRYNAPARFYCARIPMQISQSESIVLQGSDRTARLQNQYKVCNIPKMLHDTNFFKDNDEAKLPFLPPELWDGSGPISVPLEIKPKTIAEELTYGTIPTYQDINEMSSKYYLKPDKDHSCSVDQDSQQSKTPSFLQPQGDYSAKIEDFKNKNHPPESYVYYRNAQWYPGNLLKKKPKPNELQCLDKEDVNLPCYEPGKHKSFIDSEVLERQDRIFEHDLVHPKAPHLYKNQNLTSLTIPTSYVPCAPNEVDVQELTRNPIAINARIRDIRYPVYKNDLEAEKGSYFAGEEYLPIFDPQYEKIGPIAESNQWRRKPIVAEPPELAEKFEIQKSSDSPIKGLEFYVPSGNEESDTDDLPPAPKSVPEDAPNILPFCHQCDVQFDDKEDVIEIEHTDALWHAGCFKCTTCEQQLANLMYFFHKDTNNIYCGRDYAKIKGIPRCNACDELIFGSEYCLADHATYHVDHFCCLKCDNALAGSDYVLEDSGQPLCMPCYQLKAATCHVCKQLIQADQKGLTLRDVHCHANDTCFTCVTCRKVLYNAHVLFKNDKFYCSRNCFDNDTVEVE